MRAGVYREELGTITKPVTIQPYPNEEVWLDGSDPLTGLVQDGKAWRKDGWTAGNAITPMPAMRPKFVPKVLMLDLIGQQSKPMRFAQR